jgi:hypothetical protein
MKPVIRDVLAVATFAAMIIALACIAAAVWTLVFYALSGHRHA